MSMTIKPAVFPDLLPVHFGESLRYPENGKLSFETEGDWFL